MNKLGALSAILIILALSLPFHFSAAQSGTAINPLDITGLINITTLPEAPGPSQETTARLEASGLNLDSSRITWRIDGTVALSGQGEKILSFTTGEVGTRSNISVTVESSAGTFSKSRIIYPSEVDFLWQGETYVPPFYKGRAAWTSQSTLTLAAIPHVTAATGNGERSINSLNYRWSQNGKVLGEMSGKGKNSLVVNDTILSIPQNIRLEIFSDQNELLAKSSIILTPTRPLLLIYERNPLYGISFHKEVGSTYQMREKEVTFTAFPLFFDIKSKNTSDMEYVWSTNSGTRDFSSSATYRTPERASGSSQVSVRTSHTSKVLQSAQKAFQIRFNNSR